MIKIFLLKSKSFSLHNILIEKSGYIKQIMKPIILNLKTFLQSSI